MAYLRVLREEDKANVVPEREPVRPNPGRRSSFTLPFEPQITPRQLQKEFDEFTCRFHDCNAPSGSNNDALMPNNADASASRLLPLTAA